MLYQDEAQAEQGDEWQQQQQQRGGDGGDEQQEEQEQQSAGAVAHRGVDERGAALCAPRWLNFWGEIQAWFALDPPRFRALLPASWDDLALVSGWVLIF